MKQDEYIQKCKEKHDNKYDYSLTHYKGSNYNIDIICHEHGIFKQNAYYHKKGGGCPKCAIEKNTNKKRNRLSDIIEKCKKLYSDIYNYDHINIYKNMHDKIEVECIYHGFFKTNWHQHINKKRGCLKCHRKKLTDTKINFIIKSIKVHGDKYDYSLVNYMNNKTKVKIKCPIHGVFKQRPRDHTNSSQGCPICNESKGEKQIRKYLDKNNIKYECQKTFNGCIDKKQLFYDFYLPKYDSCIEFDGEQHFKIVENWGGLKSFNDRKNKDNIKNNYCENNKIKLLRIKYDNNIEEKLNKFLNNKDKSRSYKL